MLILALSVLSQIVFNPPAGNPIAAPSYDMPRYIFLANNYMPSTLETGSQNGLFSDQSDFLDFGPHSSSEYSIFMAYQQDLDQKLTIIYFKELHDGTSVPSAIVNIVYVPTFIPEPSSVFLFSLLGLFRRIV